MSRSRCTRRGFLRKSVGIAAAGAAAPYIFTAADLRAQQPTSKNDRPNFGCIGNGKMGFVGYMHDSDLDRATEWGTVVAVCDVDRTRAEAASDGGKRTVYEDYRKLLDRKDIDAVTVSTPDHWHTKISIDAMRAGKDVYCQKPLTLTIDEGKKLCKVVEETGRVLQVGTQQRSGDGRFLEAVAMCHLGRIGKMHRVTCAIGDAPSGGPFKKTAPPPELNWDMWLGQAPKVDYIPERCHHTFRWWYEYSGGIMTDWGAHHIDIAQWAIGMDQSGPISVEPISYNLPVPFDKGYPKVDDCFNTATAFTIKCTFSNGVEMIIRHDTDNGILFEGEKGRFFVNRGKLVGKPVEQLQDDPLPDDVLTKLRKGKPAMSHMENFVACIKDRSMPISDVFSHHRALTTGHLANLAMRFGREKLTWDPQTEQIVGDDEANAWLSRPQRKGFEIEV